MPLKRSSVSPFVTSPAASPTRAVTPSGGHGSTTRSFTKGVVVGCACSGLIFSIVLVQLQGRSSDQHLGASGSRLMRSMSAGDVNALQGGEQASVFSPRPPSSLSEHVTVDTPAQHSGFVSALPQSATDAVRLPSASQHESDASRKGRANDVGSKETSINTLEAGKAVQQTSVMGASATNETPKQNDLLHSKKWEEMDKPTLIDTIARVLAEPPAVAVDPQCSGPPKMGEPSCTCARLLSWCLQSLGEDCGSVRE